MCASFENVCQPLFSPSEQKKMAHLAHLCYVNGPPFAGAPCETGERACARQNHPQYTLTYAAKAHNRHRQKRRESESRQKKPHAPYTVKTKTNTLLVFEWIFSCSLLLASEPVAPICQAAVGAFSLALSLSLSLAQVKFRVVIEKLFPIFSFE